MQLGFYGKLHFLSRHGSTISVSPPGGGRQPCSHPSAEHACIKKKLTSTALVRGGQQRTNTGSHPTRPTLRHCPSCCFPGSVSSPLCNHRGPTAPCTHTSPPPVRRPQSWCGLLPRGRRPLDYRQVVQRPVPPRPTDGNHLRIGSWRASGGREGWCRRLPLPAGSQPTTHVVSSAAVAQMHAPPPSSPAATGSGGGKHALPGRGG